jgi:hypothetical protein
MTTPTTDAKTYTGSCHCGAVRFEATFELKQVLACNCSICSRTGALLAFVPVAQFKLLSGEDAQRDYQFGKKHLHHLFCLTCGIRSFAVGARPDGTEMRAINVRCLEGVEVSGLPVQHFDGKSR